MTTLEILKDLNTLADTIQYEAGKDSLSYIDQKILDGKYTDIF